MSFRPFTTAAVLCVALTGALPASATSINGSVSLSSAGVVDTGVDLSTRQTFDLVGLQVGIGSGQFSVAPTGTMLTSTTLDLGNTSSFSITGSNFGSFTITAGQAAEDVTVNRTASNLDLYLLGTFTPATPGNLSAYTAGAASLRISLNRTGSGNNYSIGAGATLASPPATIPVPPTPVPEPATLGLLGVGILGLGLSRRGRKTA